MKEDLDKIFETLVPILKKYSPPFSIARPSSAVAKKRNFGLVSNKEVVIAGRKRSEVYFAGIIKQKNYVGFYYMLAYSDPKITKKLDPKFLKLLHGKTCFYIKSTDKFILDEIRKSLDLALKYYQNKHWV